jgi:hypothetical protein
MNAHLETELTQMPIIQSRLLRKLAESRNDPARQRVLGWLKDIDYERLSAFGFTSEDIAALRRRTVSGIWKAARGLQELEFDQEKTMTQ